MPKMANPLEGLQDELCEAWEASPERVNPEFWLTMNMFNFYRSLRSEFPELADRMPRERGDEIWQRVKILLLRYETEMGRR